MVRVIRVVPRRFSSDDTLLLTVELGIPSSFAALVKLPLCTTFTNTEISFSSSSCTDYILGFNINSQTTYRLKGFNGNDLLFLIRDINNISSSKSSSKKLLLSLNDLNIGLDFSAIYKALLNLNFEAECLKICSDGKEAHGRIKK